MAVSRETADAIVMTCESANEADLNGEPANLVDGLFAIARAIRYLGDRVASLAPEEPPPF